MDTQRVLDSYDIAACVPEPLLFCNLLKFPGGRPMPYPRNPHYGNGVFRRRIALTRHDTFIDVQLEDCNHGFQLKLFHDGERVTDIQAQALRIPLSTCPGSVEALKKFIGLPLVAQRQQLRELSASGQHCTHLYDMVGLAMAQALRGTAQRVYDIAIADFKSEQTLEDQQTTANVHCNAQLVHSWTITRTQVMAPAALNAKPLYKGFLRWATQLFTGDELEAAFVLQIGCFVAQGRFYDIEAIADQSVQPVRVPLGACYSYQPERIELAKRSAGSTRDFTQTPELLLRFV
jgi:hypothetical protein